ncbi:DUF4907 domain-containing protein [Flavobacteriaceae bacterium M23B6Z8]
MKTTNLPFNKVIGWIILTISIITLLYTFFKMNGFNHHLNKQPKDTTVVFELVVGKINDHSWYYQIFRNGNLIIQQNTIPAARGTQFFTSYSDAFVIGNLVTEKLQRGENPKITVKELMEKGISFKN